MSRRAMWFVSLVLAGALVSTSYGVAVNVGNFEGQLDGWRAGTGITLSFSATGATAGSQALQVTGPGGWHINALQDAKSQRATLANKGVKITADVTAFAADMTTQWMGVEFVINAQSNNDNGANNNVGWNELGFQDVIRDGQLHTYTWVLSDALTAKIAGADDNVSWFELALVTNLDSASVTKLYVDNIQISYELPTSSVMIGDFENGRLDNWVKYGTEPTTLTNSTVGATSGQSSLAVATTAGYWCLQWNAPTVPATLKDQKLQFDLTMIASEWPVGRWTKVADKVALNSDSPAGWKEYTNPTVVDKLTGASTSADWGRWWDGAPDVVKTYTVDISDYDLTGATWFQINIAVQGGDGVAHFYFDNIQLVGPAAKTGKSTDVVFSSWEQTMDGWTVGAGADVRYGVPGPDANATRTSTYEPNGVTLGNYSLDVWLPDKTEGWLQGFLKMNLLEPNQAAVLAAFKTNTKISVDITRKVDNWPADAMPGWDEIVLVINTGGDGWSGWYQLPVQAGWRRTDGNKTQTATWDYSQYLSQMHMDNLTWCELWLIANSDSNYTALHPRWFYLDNMRFSGGGVTQNPSPANGATNVDINTNLGWSAGPYAAQHNVYLGTSAGMVTNATADSHPDVIFAQVDGASFDPNGLAFDTRYYWRVDAVNDVNPDSPWKGAVWSFTTANAIIVDNFETYTDDVGSEIFQVWADGLADPALGGSMASNFNPPWAEQTSVHAGRQAMPLNYDNTKSKTSEAVRTWAQPQDWTRNSYNTLKLYVYGTANNGVDPLYITLQDSAGHSATKTCDIAAILTTEAWTEWSIPAGDFTGVNLAAVTRMTIGVGNPQGSPSKSMGRICIDDIQVAARPMGLVAYYPFEGNLDDASGNGHAGTLAGDANFPTKYVAGPAGKGQAMLFDGADHHQYVNIGTFNPSVATGKLSISLWVKWDGPTDLWQGFIGKRQHGDWVPEVMMWYFELERGTWEIRFGRPSSMVDSGQTLAQGQWTHLALTFDGTTAKAYIDGVLVKESAFAFAFDKEAPMQIGASADGGGNPFNGAIDEVRLYDTALSEAEVKALAGK